MDLDLLMKITAFLFGLIWGSFVNVCIYRIPIKKSIVFPSSSCTHCGERIRFYDNIPVLSYLILLGKCRACRKPISMMYPIVELMTGLLSFALFLRYGLSLQYFLSFLFVSALVTTSFIDLHHKIIPDVISLPGILSGLIISFFHLGQISFFDSLVGAIGGGGFLFLVGVLFEWITGKEGMGGGDVKLLAMIGAWMGWRALPFVILISSLTGTLIGGGSMLISGRGVRGKIPFGPFLSLGALIFFFYGTELVSWYLGILTT